MTATSNEPPNATQQDGPFGALIDFAQERGYKLDWLHKAEIWGSGADSDLSRGGLLLQDLAGSDSDEAPDESDNRTGPSRAAG